MRYTCEISGPDGRPFYYLDELGIKPYVESALFGVDYPDPFPGEYRADIVVDIAHISGLPLGCSSRDTQPLM
jgi:hypothetical protein